MVVYLYGSRRTVCPSGFSDFADAHGRFLVFASASKNMTDNNIVSPAAPVVISKGYVGEHSHYIDLFNFNPQGPGVTTTIPADQTATGAALYPSRMTLGNGFPINSYLGIPYVQLRTCKVTGPPTRTLASPDPSMIFFYDGQICPGNWIETSSRADGSVASLYANLPGRMIVNLYSPNTFPGQVTTDGATLTCASGPCGITGHSTHVHTASMPTWTLPKSTGTILTTGAAGSGTKYLGES
jgi:hypothetical protein